MAMLGIISLIQTNSNPNLNGPRPKAHDHWVINNNINNSRINIYIAINYN